MGYETIETSADGTARLLKATKGGSEYLYIEIINDGKEPVLLENSMRKYGKARFPEIEIEALRKGFKEAGYPISDEWQGKWNLGAWEWIKKIKEVL